MSFVERHAAWSAAQHEAARRMLEEVTERGLQVVRFSFCDQHGILRRITSYNVCYTKLLRILARRS